MKNFDKEWEGRRSEDARTFTVGGETFVLKKAVKPELFDQMQDVDPDASISETYVLIDNQFKSMIEDGDGEAGARYDALRAKPDELGVRDLREVIDWMVEELTGRAPTLPQDSQPSRGRTGTRSTAGSSSRALTAVSRA